ncbi:MAG TPA: IclR family transcriptional regulator C-terminal domain-containing protein [Asanoa sp.]|nr:IclR family transcriptional regulator C-terminal domain-containing protein [Asanoa sp.]
MTIGPDRSNGSFVQSLDKGLAVIRAFSRSQPRLRLTDVARETGLTRAAARRFLLTLETLGYVGSDGHQFYLRPRVLELGYAFLSSFGVVEIAQDHLEQLAAELHESCSASVLDGHDITYVARASTNRIMTIALSVGTRLPAYATSMGRVLLAAQSPDDLDRFLATVKLEPLTRGTITDPEALRAVVGQVRAQGWSIVDQELEDGVRSVAVAVHDARGAVVAAINTSAHAARVPLRRLQKEFLPLLRRTGAAIDADLRSVR